MNLTPEEVEALLASVEGDGRRVAFSLLCPACQQRVPFVRNLGQIGIHPDPRGDLCRLSFLEVPEARGFEPFRDPDAVMS
ncbi:MAG: hypothetical protein QOE90_3040 [Thermoplasmata archaeon]|nr:hypothetical protein [Thermoplasmata archaeon]